MSAVPEDKKTMFIHFDEINTKTKALYSFLLILGISATFMLVSYHFYPIYLAGEMAFHTYLIINAGISLLWVGLINIVNRYVLQDKLINKGTSHVNC